MKTMNDAVKEQFAQLNMALCEARVLISDREARIAELEEQLSLPRARPKKADKLLEA